MHDNLNCDLDAQVSEMEVAKQAVDFSDQAITVTEETITTLESIVVSIEHTLVTYGLSRQEACLTQLALDSQYRRVGIVCEYPSLETYGGTQSRLQATQETYTDAKNRLQELWKMLMQMVKRAWLAILNFFDSVLGTAALLEKAANETVEQAKTLDSRTAPHNSTVSLSPTIAARLAVGVHVNWDIPRNLEKTSQRLVNDGNRLTELLRESFHGMRDAILHKDPSKLGFIGKAIEQTTASGFQNRYEKIGRAYLETAVLPGNKRFQLSYILQNHSSNDPRTPEGLESLTRMVSSMHCELIEAPSSGKIVTTMNTLSLGDIISIAEQVAVIARWSQVFKKQLSNLSKEAEDAMRATGARVFTVGSAPMVGHANNSLVMQIVDKNYDNIYRAYAHTAAFMVKPALLLQHYLIRTARASLYVSQKNLSEYTLSKTILTEPAKDPGTELIRA